MSTVVYYSSYLQPRYLGQYLRTNLFRHPVIDNSKVKSIGMEFIPVEDTIKDTVNDLERRGELRPPKKSIVPLVLAILSPVLAWAIYRKFWG